MTLQTSPGFLLALVTIRLPLNMSSDGTGRLHFWQSVRQWAFGPCILCEDYRRRRR